MSKDIEVAYDKFKEMKSEEALWEHSRSGGVLKKKVIRRVKREH